MEALCGEREERAMSQEDVEVVRGLYDGWLRGEAGLELFDPEISMVESATLPGAASAYGIDAVRRYMESFDRHWDGVRFEPQEFIDAGDGQVVVVARLVGTGRLSGVEVTRTWAYVWTVAGGKVHSMVGYADRDEALGAVAAQEKGAPQPGG
jgi:ketosteroid isomerase-like protein